MNLIFIISLNLVSFLFLFFMASFFQKTINETHVKKKDNSLEQLTDKLVDNIIKTSDNGNNNFQKK